MFNKLVRLGRDAEIRYTANQKAVTSLACVYDIGWGDNKKSQWIEISLWGKQAESLTQYLTKGKQIVVYADDVELEEYQKNDGSTGSKLKARAVNIDLTSGGQTQPLQQQAPQQQGGFQGQQMPSQQLAQKRAQQPKVNPQEPTIDFDDSIPFAPIGLQHRVILNCM
jgi:single-strand DNA-binding protein